MGDSSATALLVAVMGCTGRQGGAVVDALLQSGCRVRGVTRSVQGAAAKVLADRGVEIVHGDMDKPSTLEQAFAGCQAAFLMTDHFAHLNAQREIQQACNMFDACKAAGVRHVIWSSLDDTRPLATGVLKSPDGEFPVPHLDAKAVAAEHLATSGLTYTVLITCGFMEMFVSDITPQPMAPGWLCRWRNRDPARPLVGSWSVAANVDPETRMPWVSCEDIGHIAAIIIQQGPDKWGGKTLSVVTDILTMGEVAQRLSEATGATVKPLCASDAFMLRLMTWLGGVPHRAAADVVNMMSYIRRFNREMLANRDVGACRALHPGALTLRAWADKHRDELIQGMRGGAGSTFMKGRTVR